MVPSLFVPVTNLLLFISIDLRFEPITRLMEAGFDSNCADWVWFYVCFQRLLVAGFDSNLVTGLILFV